MSVSSVIRIMIYLGSALMVFNIARYAGFIKRMRWIDKSPRVHRALYLPVTLLIAFLAGYLAVAWFGKPDLIVASILLGGSIFVCIILMVLYFIVEKVMDSEEALLEARQANTAKSQFFANMSHDLRTPLNAIIGYTQLGLRKDTSAEDMHGYLEKISSSGDHLLTLINDVLEMSRIETGHMELKPEETDLCNVLCGIRDMFAEQMRQKNVAFTVDGDTVQNRRVLCDTNRLNRILLNLVSNAYKFTPEGGSVSVTLKQTGRRDDLADYELTVADTGIGMSEEFAARIFEPFERERTSTVSGIQGTGLGMAITKAIVDSMDGCIDVQSKQGEGSLFTVLLTFPVLSGEEGGCRCEEKPAEPGKRDYTGRRLLLAEDNEINREIACAILTDAGFAVDTAENGQVAVGMLEGSTPGTYDAVLMDIQMPVMDGFEASKTIRSLPDAALAAVPIIAMTANAFAEDVAAERAAGMNAHISKPLNQRDMFRTLEEILFN